MARDGGRGPKVCGDVPLSDPHSLGGLVPRVRCLSFLEVLTVSVFVSAKSAHAEGRHFGG